MRTRSLPALAVATLIACVAVTAGIYHVRPAGAAEPVFDCSEKLARFKADYQSRAYAAFARGRANTITGMRGCGLAWNQESQHAADALAMSLCRQRARDPDRCYISDRTRP
jgi:hypothetical protein